NVVGAVEHGYGVMPRVEQTLASYLSAGVASSLKALTLPTKLLHTTSALVGKGYSSAGIQADLLKELDEGEEIKVEDITELRRATDLSLRATKETAHAIGRSMAAMVAAERHLSHMKDRDRLLRLLGGSSRIRVPPPRTGPPKKRVSLPVLPRRGSRVLGGAQSRSQLRRRRTCGPFFRQRRLWLRSPDIRGSGLLRADPSGEERLTPHHTVPVSPQCSPQEIVLPTLPPMVLQGAAISSELISSAQQRSGAGRLATSEEVLRMARSVVPCRSPTLGHRSSRSGNTRDNLAAWKRLPKVSQWVLHTVERGYRIQFGSPPPLFYGVLPTLVGPEQALVMEQEVNTLLRKEAIEVFPPDNRESGFYSRYFIVPKKDGGLRPILDLRLLNRAVMCLRFKMLTLSQVISQIRSKDWFVTIDLKDAYFHISILPQHRKFLRFAFRGEAYQYR
ncbi:hypothetical protein M9458_056526, partial [Cirrhinus mrigala]